MALTQHGSLECSVEFKHDRVYSGYGGRGTSKVRVSESRRISVMLPTHPGFCLLDLRLRTFIW